jgi:hypothetical protein
MMGFSAFGCLASGVFFKPIDVSAVWLWMLLPLCLSVAVVYKTTKLRQLRRLPFSVAALFSTILLAVMAIAGVLYVLVYLWPG